MNRQNQSATQKTNASYHQRQKRRTQIIIVAFSVVLILSMVLSLIKL